LPQNQAKIGVIFAGYFGVDMRSCFKITAFPRIGEILRPKITDPPLFSDE